MPTTTSTRLRELRIEWSKAAQDDPIRKHTKGEVKPHEYAFRSIGNGIKIECSSCTHEVLTVPEGWLSIGMLVVICAADEHNCLD